MVVQFLDELIATTGHLMSLVYLPRIVHEKRMPKGFKPNNVVNIFLFDYTIDGNAKGQEQKDPAFRKKTLSAGKAHCMATINKKKNNIVSAIVNFPSHHTP